MKALTFREVLEDAERKYESKFPKYGDSWKDCDIYQLRWRIKEEFEEWLDLFYNKKEHRTDEEEYDELLDLINVASMVATRLKKEN